tara:strand:+ start:214 stop:639 length:426 start_codon:yes stop_codon:yes gene_type:complete
MNIIDGISDLKNFGIDLKLNSIDAEAFYCEALRLWFEDEKGYDTVAITDREFTIEIMGEGDVATIYISDSTLRMLPIQEDSMEILLCILEFVAQHHKQTIMVYNYICENEEEVSSLFDKADEVILDTKEEKSEEEESDEWI